MKHLLDRETIERCINPAQPAIAPGEPFHNLIHVVVGAGVYRTKTVALHSRVSGKGSRIAKQPRRVDVVATPLDSISEDWKQDAKTLAAYIRGVGECSIYVDSMGLGSMFGRALELELGESYIVRPAHFAAKPDKGESWNVHFSLRTQGAVHAAEAFKDARVSIAADNTIAWTDQGARLLIGKRPDGQYQMQTQDQMREAGIPQADCFDALCMAFMETVQ